MMEVYRLRLVGICSWFVVGWYFVCFVVVCCVFVCYVLINGLVFFLFFLICFV